MKTFKIGLYLSIGAITLVWCWSVTASIVFAEDIRSIAGTFWDLFIASMTLGAVTLAIIVVLLKLAGDRLDTIGFNTMQFWRRLGFGCVLGLGLFLLATFIVHPITSSLVPSGASDADLGRLLTNLWHLPLWLLLSIVVGGLSEELWRAFTLDRFERCFGWPGLLIAVGLGSAVFAVGHLYQGIDSVITTGVISLIYAGVYIARRSAVEIVTAHAARDITSIVVGYALFL